MSSGWVVDYNPKVCDGHYCPMDCEVCPYQLKAQEANYENKPEEDTEN